MFIALIVVVTVSGRIHDIFSTGWATLLDLVIFIGVFILTYKVFRHFREM
jgi:uncharacterized membrane protein YhaH (DUF805 family)